ncbi:MAG: YajQ family cyclic di-GMP-binding protein [Deltaproteobacteria bacterium]|nr:YajQ family cyclic di-GMP-binding protein [Deltaproteobacteria bacterium]
MPSFDVVSKVDLQEVDNAINQVMREIGQRYDFRGSKSQVTLDKEGIRLVADDEYKAKAVLDMMREKCVKRNVDTKALDVGTIEPAGGGLVKCLVRLKEGIPTETAKEMVKQIKDLGLKVQAQIQDEQLRVSGKKRDDLQTVMATVRGGNYDVPLQFTNFRE